MTANNPQSMKLESGQQILVGETNEGMQILNTEEDPIKLTHSEAARLAWYLIRPKINSMRELAKLATKFRE